MKASDLFIKCLENEGVEYIFGLPGEQNLDILESLKDSKIKFIVCRDERSAGFMAATYGRLTGKAGVVMTTLGPGATNLVTAAAYANLGAMPLIMLTGQKAIKNRKIGHFQIVNTVEIMDPLTKMAKQLVDAKTIPSLVRDAFKTAEQERPGAVLLEIPDDIIAEDIEGKPIRRVEQSFPSADIERIIDDMEIIYTAKRPLILIGAGASRTNITGELKNFIDKTGIPFFTTQIGKGVIDERHELHLGTAALSANDYIHCAIERSDLIINIGHDVVEKPPFIMKENGFKVIHINFNSAVFDSIYFPQLEIVGDIKSSIKELTNRIEKTENWDFTYFKKIKKQIDEHMLLKINEDNFPMIPQRIVNDLRKALPEDSYLCLDNGMYKLWFSRNYRTYFKNTLLLDNSLATMGAGLPSAIAAKLVNKNKEVICLAGDGGFMMTSHEIETAKRLGLNLTIIILNDNGYGMIKWEQEERGFKNFGLEYENPDFIKYAESFGAKGFRIDNADKLESTVKKALKEKGIKLIEVPVDYSENYKFFTKELKEKTCLL